MCEYMAKKINIQRLTKLQISEHFDFCERNCKKSQINFYFRATINFFLIGTRKVELLVARSNNYSFNLIVI
jgi:hypothetical protein